MEVAEGAAKLTMELERRKLEQPVGEVAPGIEGAGLEGLECSTWAGQVAPLGHWRGGGNRWGGRSRGGDE